MMMAAAASKAWTTHGEDMWGGGPVWKKKEKRKGGLDRTPKWSQGGAVALERVVPHERRERDPARGREREVAAEVEEAAVVAVRVAQQRAAARVRAEEGRAARQREIPGRR